MQKEERKDMGQFLDLHMEGYFFGHFFFGLAFGFWLLAFGFWLLAPSGLYLLQEPKSLICVLFAAVWSQFACPFGFWLWLHLTLGFWFLFFVVFFGFGFTWLLAFGRTSVECMCSIVVCI